MKFLTVFSILIMAAASLFTASNPFAPHAPGYNYIDVTTILDEYDLSGSGAGCSLREAITASVTNAPFGGCGAGSDSDHDVIALPAGTFAITRNGNDDTNVNGDFDIDSGDMTYLVYLQGSGQNATYIDGGDLDRVFDIAAGSMVRMDDLTITNGQSRPADTKAGKGGGIYNAGRLDTYFVTVSENLAGRNITSSDGGGIYNIGLLYLSWSYIAQNDTLNADFISSGGNGGGIYNTGFLSIERTTIYNNETGDSGSYGASTANGGDGGGIYNTGEIDGLLCTIQYNHTGNSLTTGGHGGHGGAIYNSGYTSLDKCTLDHNYTGNGTSNDAGNGGAIFSSGSMNLYNTTVSENYTGNGATGATYYGQGGDGAGIYNLNNNSMNIFQTTITLNVAGTGNPNGAGGGLMLVNSQITLEQSILANNSTSAGGSDCVGGLFSPEYNLIEANACAFNGSPVGNLTAIDPLLGILQMNGGENETHALQFNSPAIDSASASCHSAEDQREMSRPVDGDRDGLAECDMGAYEAQYFLFLPMTLK